MTLARKGWEYTPDQLANFSSESVRNKSTMLTNSVTGETLTYPSMNNAAEFLGTTVTTLRNYLAKNLPYNGYIISINEVKELSSKPQSLLLTNIKDSSSKEFSTIKDAAVFLGVSRSSLSYALNKSNNGEDNACKIRGYKVTRIENEVNYIRPGSKSIEVTDLESNTTNIYPSITLAGLAIGVSKASVSQYLRGKQATPYLGRYTLKDIS
jgi:predicted transcriptional regulator